MKHFIIDQSGKAIMQGKNDKKPKNLFEAEGGNVHCVAKNPSNTYDVAIGSKDQVVQLWDITTSKQLWTGKNLPNDHLDLKIPIWDTDLCWLSRSNTYSLAACTAYSDVREYDTRGPRKPVIASKIFDNSTDRY